MKIDLYNKICELLSNIIKDTKFESHLYAVGGCVRDSLIGDEIKDIDLVIDLPNGGIEFANWLEENNRLDGSVVVYPTYGTAMFRLKEYPDIELESVQTRKEQYKDKTTRNPETCHGTLEEDCLRRDLTINALYKNISNGEIIDLVGGINDLKNKIIKTPTNPGVIFDDDPLRMLRVIRFKLRFDAEFDEITYEAIQRNAFRIRIITQERITDEMMKTLSCVKKPSEAYYLWSRSGLIKEILPNMYEYYNEFYHDEIVMCEMLDMLTNRNNLALLYATMFLGIPEELDKLRLSNNFKKEVLLYIHSLKYIKNNKSLSFIRKMEHELGQYIDDAIEFIIAYVATEYTKPIIIAEYGEALRRMHKLLVSNGTAITNNSKLPINGNDIMKEFNITQGIEVKKYIDKSWEYFYDNPNITKEEIINKIKNNNNIIW